MRHLVDLLGFSQRHACKIVGVSRSSFQRASSKARERGNADKYAPLRLWLTAWARENPRWGYRRAWIKARAEGFDVERDVVRRLWRQEGLRVFPRQRPATRRLCEPVRRSEPAACVNDVWALDFQFDSDEKGRAIKICHVIDEFTREHIGYRVERRIDAARVIETLDIITCQRGTRPRVLRMDNGPEFISHALQAWAKEGSTIQAFIPPGQPWHNGFVESLHNRMRDELYKQESFADLEHARHCVEAWSRRYNTYHPHSALGFQTPEEYKKQWLESSQAARP